LVYDVVIVGSGFSAIAVACNLIERLPASAAIAIAGDDPGFGRGTAYRTELFLHRLNVPAGRMSLFPDRPHDFVDWLERHGHPLQAGDFASRGDYGLYLRDTLAALLRNRAARCRVDVIKAKATGCVERHPAATAFYLDNGDEIAGRSVVLCLGVGNAKLPVTTAGLDADLRSHVVENPWRLSWLHRVGASDKVCILGSGLTMIDQVLALRAHGHKGSIEVLSRRGLAPHAHARNPSPPIPADLPAPPYTISALLHALRKQCRAGDDWRAVMDGLRPVTQALWQQLDMAERARFLRHALPWWNIHRHRLSPAVFDRFQELRDHGTVTLHAGYLQAIGEDGHGLQVRYRVRGRREIASLDADWIVNCTGMERAGIDHSPLLKEMKRHGMIHVDPLGLGIVVDRDSRVLNGEGEPQPGLFAIGALTAGQFWEITAVPDIRVQAKRVADAVAGAQ
jgi:uncharacterized NAD(P)/FAD-binding protein YdhS